MHAKAVYEQPRDLSSITNTNNKARDYLNFSTYFSRTSSTPRRTTFSDPPNGLLPLSLVSCGGLSAIPSIDHRTATGPESCSKQLTNCRSSTRIDSVSSTPESWQATSNFSTSKITPSLRRSSANSSQPLRDCGRWRLRVRMTYAIRRDVLMVRILFY